MKVSVFAKPTDIRGLEHCKADGWNSYFVAPFSWVMCSLRKPLPATAGPVHMSSTSEQLKYSSLDTVMVADVALSTYGPVCTNISQHKLHFEGGQQMFLWKTNGWYEPAHVVVSGQKKGINKTSWFPSALENLHFILWAAEKEFATVTARPIPSLDFSWKGYLCFGSLSVATVPLALDVVIISDFTTFTDSRDLCLDGEEWASSVFQSSFVTTHILAMSGRLPNTRMWLCCLCLSFFYLFIFNRTQSPYKNATVLEHTGL